MCHNGRPLNTRTRAGGEVFCRVFKTSPTTNPGGVVSLA